MRSADFASGMSWTPKVAALHRHAGARRPVPGLAREGATPLCWAWIAGSLTAPAESTNATIPSAAVVARKSGGARLAGGPEFRPKKSGRTHLRASRPPARLPPRALT